MLGGPHQRSGFPPPSGRVTPPLCGLVLLRRSQRWSLTSLQHRLVRTGGRLVEHALYHWLLLAERHLTRRLFGTMLRRIWALPVPDDSVQLLTEDIW